MESKGKLKNDSQASSYREIPMKLEGRISGKARDSQCIMEGSECWHLKILIQKMRA